MGQHSSGARWDPLHPLFGRVQCICLRETENDTPETLKRGGGPGIEDTESGRKERHVREKAVPGAGGGGGGGGAGPGGAAGGELSGRG